MAFMPFVTGIFFALFLGAALGVPIALGMILCKIRKANKTIPEKVVKEVNEQNAKRKGREEKAREKYRRFGAGEPSIDEPITDSGSEGELEGLEGVPIPTPSEPDEDRELSELDSKYDV